MSHPFHLLGLLSHARRVLLFFRECFLDSLAYLRAATVLGYSGSHRATQMESAVVRLSHILEKGLCMPDFRPRFGSEVLSQLQTMLSDPKVLAEVSEEQMNAARAVIQAYREHHCLLEIDISDMIRPDLRDAECAHLEAMGGVKPFAPVAPDDGSAFFRVLDSRASVRDFDNERMPENSVIEECVTAAIRSPSVCNRQTWRVHAYTGTKVSEMLALQNGNRGFGHKIPILFVITTDMRQFSGAAERYQPWIEGGIFTMAFLLALHAKGMASVSLNWSVTNEADKKLRSMASIPSHERTIVLIGCGYPKKGALVPISHRRRESEILTWHD